MKDFLKSRKFEQNPSIRQLFPPKILDNSISISQEVQQKIYSVQDKSQCWPISVNPVEGNYVSIPVRPDAPHTNASPVVSSPTPQQAVVSIDQPNNSHTIHVGHDHFTTQNFPSPGTAFPLQTIRDEALMNINMYVPLYRAALKGDWEEAKRFLNMHPGAECARITKGWETALHIATGAKHMKFVEELVNVMSAKDLAMQNQDGNTTLCFAAVSGITGIAEVMVKKNKHLPRIRGSLGVTPLYMAALLGHGDMVWYLYSVTDDNHLTLDDCFGLLVATIATDLYDFALHILRCHPDLAMYHGQDGETALHMLAQKPSAFASGNQLRIWERCIYPWIPVELHGKFRCPSSSSKNQAPMCIQDNPSLTGLLRHTVELLVPGIKRVYKKKLLNMQAEELVKRLWNEVMVQDETQFGDLLKGPSDPLFIAAEFGIVEFVASLVHSCPDLIWKVDKQNRSLFHIAVVHRQEKIFSLIYNIGAHKDLITSYKDDNNHNMLHLAGKLAPADSLNSVSGAALQMQRELLWFKEVEKIIQPLYKEMRDSEGRTPRILFTEEHKGLVKEGEKWMKNTASSCMLVATLITTVMFAAIFTVPGGNNEHGIPINLKAEAFPVFFVSDVFALFSSVTAVLIFLSILTSRYADEDFLKALPQRLSIGFAALFLSIITMLIAFSAAFFLVLGHKWAWIVIPVALIACIPVTFFTCLQFPLLIDTIRCTCGRGAFYPQSK